MVPDQLSMPRTGYIQVSSLSHSLARSLAFSSCNSISSDIECALLARINSIETFNYCSTGIFNFYTGRIWVSGSMWMLRHSLCILPVMHKSFNNIAFFLEIAGFAWKAIREYVHWFSKYNPNSRICYAWSCECFTFQRDKIKWYCKSRKDEREKREQTELLRDRKIKLNSRKKAMKKREDAIWTSQRLEHWSMDLTILVAITCISTTWRGNASSERDIWCTNYLLVSVEREMRGTINGEEQRVKWGSKESGASSSMRKRGWQMRERRKEAIDTRDSLMLNSS